MSPPDEHPDRPAASLFPTAICALLLVASPLAAEQPDQAWTKDDRRAALDAAIANVTAPEEKLLLHSKLVQVANALAVAGDMVRARDIARRAAAGLVTPDKLTAPYMGEVSERATSIQLLARTGLLDEANAMANVDVPPTVKELLVSAVRRGRVEGGDVAHAAAEIARIAGVPASADWIGSGAAVSTSRLVTTLVSIGATDEAQRVIAETPDSLRKINAYASLASKLCESPDADAAKGREAAAGAAGVAQRIFTAGEARGNADRTTLVAAARVTAACGQVTEASGLVTRLAAPDLIYTTLGEVADGLIREGKLDVARAIAPRTHPKRTDILVLASQRALRMKQDAAARGLALAAYEVFAPPTEKAAYERAAGSVTEALTASGAFDKAFEAIQDFDEANRRSRYVRLALSIIRRHDSDALARLFPRFKEELKRKDNGTRPFEIVRALLLNGYRMEAESFARELEGIADTARLLPGTDTAIADRARFKALTGDIAGAIADAGRAGAMTTKPNPAMGAFLLAWGIADMQKTPTPGEIVTAGKHIAGIMATDIPGPRAHVLRQIVFDLVELGDLDAARQVQRELEVAPRDILDQPRNIALKSIAQREMAAGKNRAALATARRMNGHVQWEILSKLIVRKPDS